MFLKYEAAQPTGSMKDRLAWHLVQSAISSGELRPGMEIVDVTSGSWGNALAPLAELYEHPLTLIVDSYLDAHTRDRFVKRGVKLLMSDKPGQQGRQDVLLNYLEPVPGQLRDTATYWSPNQYFNESGPVAYRAAGTEASEDLPGGIEVGAVVGAVGTGASLRGFGAGVRETHPGARLVAVDGFGSVTFGQPSGERPFPGIGGDTYMPLVPYEEVNRVHLMGRAPAAIYANRVARQLPDAPVGLGAGAVVAAAVHEAWRLRSGQAVVALVADGPDRYPYLRDPNWLAENKVDLNSDPKPTKVAASNQHLFAQWRYADTIVPGSRTRS